MYFNPTHWFKQKRRHVKSDKTLECFLKKIRNGFAHIDTIVPINDEGKWIGVKIMDINKGNKNNVELEMTLMYNDILVISNFISNEYKKEILNLIN
ncbi:HEPN family nuclease [Bacteroidota bacterium]